MPTRGQRESRLPSTIEGGAASALWSDFAAPLGAFLARRAPPGVDPDDVLQEVFLRIHKHLPGLRETERINAWIFQIARNALADAMRARRRFHATEDRLAAENPEADDSIGEASGAGQELALCLAPMIARLGEPYREAIELAELHGLTQTEAAKRVGLSLSGMKSRVQRGREQLKAMLLACCRIEVDSRGGVVDYARRDSSPPSCGKCASPTAKSS